LNLAVGFVVKNTLYAHDVPLLFISLLGLIVLMPWICQSTLTTLSLLFFRRYYADTVPCYKFVGCCSVSFCSGTARHSGSEATHFLQWL